MDSMLSTFFQSLHFFEIHGAEITEIRMQPFAVVKHLNVVNDTISGLLPGSAVRAKHSFSFQSSEETFQRRIIPAIAFPAHTANYAVIFKQLLKILTAILTAPVRVKKKAPRIISEGPTSACVCQAMGSVNRFPI
jgi:hypothetical protein